MRSSITALAFSVLVWVFLLRFVSGKVSYIDNGVDKLDKSWKKIIFSVPIVVLIICVVGVVGILIEFAGTIIQAVAEFLALPILYILGMN